MFRALVRGRHYTLRVHVTIQQMYTPNPKPIVSGLGFGFRLWGFGFKVQGSRRVIHFARALKTKVLTFWEYTLF